MRMKYIVRGKKVKVTDDLKSAGSDMIIGCEGAAGEPFVSQLPLNDLRFNVGYFFGKPVPGNFCTVNDPVL